MRRCSVVWITEELVSLSFGRGWERFSYHAQYAAVLVDGLSNIVRVGPGHSGSRPSLKNDSEACHHHRYNILYTIRRETEHTAQSLRDHSH